MANAFNKEEKVAFEQILEGFEDGLVLSKNVTVNSVGSDQDMERSSDVVWRPQPYIAQSFSGTDMTANFKDQTQLSVPTTIGYQRSSPWAMTAKQLRDALQNKSLGKAAAQKLASDINVAVQNIACLQGTLVVTRTAAATGFDDVARAEQLFNEQGVQHGDRYLALSTGTYNGMAGNLASRQLDNSKSLTAYERAFVGDIASFKTWKLDYANRIAVAGGTATIDTTVAGAQFYTPRATSTASTGQTSNVDNRYQTVTVSSTTSVVAGDCFTIADCYAVHHITKGATANLKTFRVISVDSATTMTVSPPIISGQGATDAELQYQNCSLSATSATATITFLNTDAADINPFWHRDAIELTPSRDGPIDQGAGVSVMRATTEQGIDVLWLKWFDGTVKKMFYRADISFGVTLLQPEMAGIMLFGQNAATP
jgi:hypothetical protein